MEEIDITTLEGKHQRGGAYLAWPLFLPRIFFLNHIPYLHIHPF